MAGSTFGNIFKITTWGESHGKALGVVVDGCPAGLPLSEEDIQKYLDRRKPGTSAITTQRKEADQVEILSGVFDGKTTGTARLQRITVPAMQITALMPNTVFGIIGVVAVLPVVRPSGVWRPELLLQRFWNRWVLPYSPIPVPSAPSMRILQNITGTLPAPPLLPCRMQRLTKRPVLICTRPEKTAIP